MRDQKNIDRLFQEKLEGFESSPRPEVWSQIQDRMQQKKKKRRIVPIWWYAGAAAVVILSLFVLLPKDVSNEQIVDPVITVNPHSEDLDSLPKKQPQQPSITPEVLKDDNTLLTDNTETDSKNTESTDKKNTPRKSVVSKTRIAENVKVNKTSDRLTDKDPSSTDDKTIATIDDQKNSFDSTKTDRLNQENSNGFNANLGKRNTEKKVDQNKDEKSIFDDSKPKDSLKSTLTDPNKKRLYTQLDEELIEDETTKKKWAVRPLIALSTVAGSSSSPTDEVFSNNTTSGNSAFNYGVSVSYQINEKISVQTGVLTQSVNFDTEQVSLVQTPGAPRNQFSNINLNESLPFALSGASDAVALSGNIISSPRIPDTDAQLNQQINYIEIPVEIKYQVTRSEKLTTAVIGGFSSLFLNNNEIILDSDITGRRSIGTANNLNSVNFSGNFGLDLDYKLYKKLFFNVNPMVKVHLNTFSRNNNGYLPVFIGVYSGIKYQF